MNRQDCAAQHFGPWLVEPHWFTQATNAVKSGDWEPHTAEEKAAIETVEEDGKTELYSVDNDGIATIQIVGQMQKGRSSFGGTSTVLTRRAIVHAAQNDEVRGIMLHVDSPGGTAAGTSDLGKTILKAQEYVPVHGYIEDQSASAACWVISQTAYVSINETGYTGSIGTVSVVADTSGYYEKEGIKVHVVSSGKYKGAFANGAEITDEHLEYLQKQVDELTDFFIDAVASGRQLEREAVEELATGEMWVAEEAKELGLVDSVEPLENAYERLLAAAKSDKSNNFKGENMFGSKDKDEEKAQEKSPLETLDALSEKFEDVDGVDAEKMANRAFRAGIDPEQAEHMAVGIKAALEVKEKELSAKKSEIEDLEKDLEEKQERIDELEAKEEELNEKLLDGNETVDHSSTTDAGEDFMKRAEAKAEEEDITFAEAMSDLASDDPKGYAKYRESFDAVEDKEKTNEESEEE